MSSRYKDLIANWRGLLVLSVAVAVLGVIVLAFLVRMPASTSSKATAAPSSIAAHMEEARKEVSSEYVVRIGHERGDPNVAEPEDYRKSNYRAPVPNSLKGAKVVSTAEAESLFESKEAIFIDVYPKPPKPKKLPKGTVWREPKHTSIEGAVWLPNVGYGVLSKAFSEYFATRLETLTEGDKAKAVVFFCLRDCWMSWNAGKRALEMGYTNVIWFPEGVDGWREFNNDTAQIKAIP